MTRSSDAKSTVWLLLASCMSHPPGEALPRKAKFDISSENFATRSPGRQNRLNLTWR